MTTDRIIAPGVTLHALQTDKFKTACVSVNFVRPHAARTAAADALLPSVLLRGTQKYPDIRSIAARMDELYGASVGALTRRKGEVKLVCLFADFIEDAFLPDGESVFAPTVEFLQEALYHPLTENGIFSEACVEGEKQNLINAIESAVNEKRSYAVSRMLEHMCAGEAYGVPRLGYADDARAITAASLWEHYRELLKTSRVEIFYAGRRPAEEAEALFSQVFANRQDAAFVPVGTQIVRRAERVRELSETMDVKQGQLVIGLRTGITASDGDYPALMLLNAVLGVGTTCKLFVNVREKLSLCYYAATRVEKYKGILTIFSGIAFEHYETAKRAILGEVDACKNGDITDEELESARRQILSALHGAEDSPATLDEFCIGRVFSNGDDLSTLREKIRRLTREDVCRAAQKLSVDTIYFLKGEGQ